MLSFPWYLSALIGFLSLSQEILWVRILGFSYQTLPQAFSFVLATYLLGIALGAALGKRLCERDYNLYVVAAVILGLAGIFDAAVPRIVAVATVPGDPNIQVPGILIVLASSLKSSLFPIVHQLGSTSGRRLGRSVSRIYFANILGSSLGPVVTGFLALDHLRVDDCFAISAATCLLAAAACAMKGGGLRTISWTAVAATLGCVIALPLPAGNSGVLPSLVYGTFSGPVTHFSTNRHGIVHTTDGPGGDVVYGGNAYDGLATTDVDHNYNRLDRLYLLALLHPAPRHVLVIGMSTGAWTRAVEGFPSVVTIDVVEINPAYVALTRDYPQLAPLLNDKRLRLHIDDGRRWLRRNPDSRFDMVIQNTTFHWRANATSLLSREYFSEVRAHLNPGGIMTANTTGSLDVLATGRAAFSHAYRYANFLYASDSPLVPVISRLESVRRPDGSMFSLGAAPHGSVVAMLSAADLEPIESFTARHGPGEVISDDNMLTEYRHGRQFGPAWLDASTNRRASLFEIDDR